MKIWHKVKIEPDCKGRHGEPALSCELSAELESWIVDHIFMDEGRYGFWANPSFLVYTFTSVEIAMAFKLRWL